MTPEELKKKIEEAAEIFARDMYGDEVPNTAYLELLMHTFKSGAELGMKLEHEIANEIIAALSLEIKQNMYVPGSAEWMNERARRLELRDKAIARWRERIKE